MNEAFLRRSLGYKAELRFPNEELLLFVSIALSGDIFLKADFSPNLTSLPSLIGVGLYPIDPREWNLPDISSGSVAIGKMGLGFLLVNSLLIY